MNYIGYSFIIGSFCLLLIAVGFDIGVNAVMAHLPTGLDVEINSINASDWVLGSFCIGAGFLTYDHFTKDKAKGVFG